MTPEQYDEVVSKFKMARDTDTKNMLPEIRSQFVQDTLVVCLGCESRPVFLSFWNKGAKEGLCLTCWERREGILRPARKPEESPF